MKKYFIIIILVAFSLLSHAQFLTVTPKIGLTLSTSQEVAQMDYIPAYLFGALVEYKISAKFSLVSGVLFEQKREKFELPLLDSNYNQTLATENMKYNYLNVPLLLEFHPFRNNHIFINGGIYTGYLLNAKAEITSANNAGNYNSTADLDISNFNRLVFGVNIGGGINIPVAKNGQILIDINYEHTLTQGTHLMDLQFKTLSISAGYAISIGR